MARYCIMTIIIDIKLKNYINNIRYVICGVLKNIDGSEGLRL